MPSTARTTPRGRRRMTSMSPPWIGKWTCESGELDERCLGHRASARHAVGPGRHLAGMVAVHPTPPRRHRAAGTGGRRPGRRRRSRLGGHLHRADVHRERAARREPAAGRRVAQVRRRARDDLERPPVGVDVRERRQGASGCTGGAVGRRPPRPGPSSATRPAYMIITRSHVSAMTDRSWVMRISDSPSSCAEVLEQLEDLGLDHDVERGRRLVADDDRRIAGEGHRDHRPLAHPARQLVRIGAAPRAFGMPTSSSSSPARFRRASRRRRRAAPRSARRSGRATRWTGLSAFIAPWKTIEISRQR